MKKLFGTDGIRSVAGEFPLERRSMGILGSALTELLIEKGLEPRILIGRDTRESGSWLEAAVFGGIRAAGGRPVSAGVIPTSALSLLAKKHAFSAAVVISASHNPYQDNGIKIFSRDGFKIPEDWEASLESAVVRPGRSIPDAPPTVRRSRRYLKEYREFLAGRLKGVVFPRKLRIVLDCANGSTSAIAAGLMRDLGLDVMAINDAPDGKNINRGCGSLHPQGLAEIVLEKRADIGIAYDGDGDRAIWVDDRGRILNGDHTLFVLAGFMKEKGRLRSDTVVATSMSNTGLEAAFEKIGLTLVRTKVGDKYVLEKMILLGANLGGEQSGHTIFLDECPTGDGILTGLRLLEVLAERDEPLSRLTEEFSEFPQILVNIPVSQKPDLDKIPEIVGVIAGVRAQLNGSGRVDVRYSGTEPLARVMVEGRDLKTIQAHARRIADAVERNLGK
jgi:phosphoglucosamine mutase